MPGDSNLADELAREREEVERLRKLLVARDAELGDARGRLLALENRWRYVLGAARRLRRAPTLARDGVATLRRPRS